METMDPSSFAFTVINLYHRDRFVRSISLDLSLLYIYIYIESNAIHCLDRIRHSTHLTIVNVYLSMIIDAQCFLLSEVTEKYYVSTRWFRIQRRNAKNLAGKLVKVGLENRSPFEERKESRER